MLTRQFVFFSSILGLVLINAALGSGATLVTTPVLVGLIWIVSGIRYATYAFGFWMVMIAPNMIQTSIFLASLLPVILAGTYAVLPHIGYVSTAAISAKLYTPQVIYIFSVGELFLDCWVSQKIGRRVLKQLAHLPYFRH